MTYTTHSNQVATQTACVLHSVFSWRRTRSPCGRCSDPRHRRLPASAGSACCSGSSPGWRGGTPSSGAPDTPAMQSKAMLLFCYKLPVRPHLWLGPLSWPRHAPRPALRVERVPVLAVHGGLLLDLVHEGGYESVHLNCLTRKHLGLKTNLNLQIRTSRVSVSGVYLEYLRNPSSILYNTKLNEQARQTVFIVLLTRLGVIPRELLKLEPEQDNLTLDIRQHEGKK